MMSRMAVQENSYPPIICYHMKVEFQLTNAESFEPTAGENISYKNNTYHRPENTFFLEKFAVRRVKIEFLDLSYLHMDLNELHT